jgi:peptidoglycan/LPS O-acetylase OafA/YrhL
MIRTGTGDVAERCSATPGGEPFLTNYSHSSTFVSPIAVPPAGRAGAGGPPRRFLDYASAVGSAMTTTGSPRRQDLDLMRATVVGGLIFFHTARIFDPLDFYVKDQPPNLPLTLFVFFAGLWGMPLLFVASGLGAWYSLRSRTATGFVRERLARLLVPFLVGLLLVVPPQVYYRLRFEQQDPGSYWEFYGDFFQVHLGLKFP